MRHLVYRISNLLLSVIAYYDAPLSAACGLMSLLLRFRKADSASGYVCFLSCGLTCPAIPCCSLYSASTADARAACRASGISSSFAAS